MKRPSFRPPLRLGLPLALLPLLAAAPAVAAGQVAAPPASAASEVRGLSPSLGAPKERDNVLALVYGEGVSDLNFVYSGDHDVSEGQPMRATAFDHGSTAVRLHVFAGRKATPSVAQSLLARVQDQQHLFATKKSDSTRYPRELNFWVGGALYVNGTPIPEPVYFAQGHHLLTNNWWIGSQSGLYDDGRDELRLHDAYDQVWCVRELGANVLQVRSCHPL